MGRQVWVTTAVAGPPDRLWHLTQDTAHHPRWDLRFSSITPAGTDDDGHQRFTYALALPHTRLPLLTVRGTGTSTAERRADDGAGTSAIRFAAGDASTDRLSPLASGAGFWRYVPLPDGRTRFTTGYDYRPGWGRLGAALDPWLTRPLVGWATAWSFDRLRLWAERGQAPERSRDLALAWTAARAAVVVLTAAALRQGFRFPMLASGTAELREAYDDERERFTIDVRVTNRRFGPLVGYRGWFTCTYPEVVGDAVPPSVKPLREEHRR